MMVTFPATETGKNGYARLDLGDSTYTVDLSSSIMTARIKVISSDNGYIKNIFQNEDPYTVGAGTSLNFTALSDWTDVVFDISAYSDSADPAIAARIGIQMGAGSNPDDTTVILVDSIVFK
jgi:hypothetical protein